MSDAVPSAVQHEDVPVVTDAHAEEDETPIEGDTSTTEVPSPDDDDMFASREALDRVVPMDPTHELPVWVREAMKAPAAAPGDEGAYTRFIQRMFMDALRMKLNMAQDARIAEAIKLAREVSENGIAAEGQGYDPTA